MKITREFFYSTGIKPFGEVDRDLAICEISKQLVQDKIAKVLLSHAEDSLVGTPEERANYLAEMVVEDFLC